MSYQQFSALWFAVLFVRNYLKEMKDKCPHLLTLHIGHLTNIVAIILKISKFKDREKQKTM